jgi:3-hydroxyisobutyrate dehydrogenase-like beta-hydroxyacid dehydrogenase
MNETIGFIGLGAMGFPMAQNLLAAGYGLRVYNRTRAKATPLEEAGAIVCDTPGAASDSVDVVVTMLADDAAVEEVTAGDNGILTCLDPDGVHLSMSTVSPDTSRHLASLHDLHDTHYVAGPVFGRPEAAAAKNLWVMLSGSAAGRAIARPVAEALGQGVSDLGDDPAAANVVKLCGNFLIGAAIEAMAEAFTLAEKAGIDRAAACSVLTQTLFASPVYKYYGRLIAAETYQPAGFALPLGQKDINLVQQIGRATRTPLPLASLLLDHLTAARAKDRDHMDWSALALEASEAAGLKPDRLR